MLRLRVGRGWVAAACAVAVLGAAQANAAIPAAERQALLDLYSSTGGSMWGYGSKWNGPVGTECTWEGVECDNGETAVGGLALRQRGVQGVLPESLVTLTNLQVLDFGTNGLTGPVPTWTCPGMVDT